MTTDVVELLVGFGYAGLAIGLALNAMGLPVASEIVLPTVGALAQEGRFDFWAVALVGIVSQIVGASIAFYLGHKAGSALLERYGRFILISPAELKTARRWFRQYGMLATIICGITPLIHGYAGYAAGIGKLSWGRFLIAATIASTIWTFGLLWVGDQIAVTIQQLRPELELDEYAAVMAVAVGCAAALAIYLIRRHHARQVRA